VTIELPSEASEITLPFWRAASRKVLVRPVCDVCGTNFFVPQIACTNCHSEAWTYQESSGCGTISTFTVVHRAPTSEHQPPYIVAVIDLDEGWHMMSNIVGSPHESVRMGQSVKVDFHSRDDGVVLPVFRLDQEAVR
jgi:uncharacterized OB-fold protein